MPSIFDGFDETVKQNFRSWELRPEGLEHSARDYYIQLSNLIAEDRPKAVELVAALMRNCYRVVSDNINEAEIKGISRPGARGQLRQATALSDARSKATFLNANDFEVTLERTIIYVQKRKPSPTHRWYNQFNVESGVGGPRAGRKSVIDLVRQLCANPKIFDLIELKEWDSGNHPLHALLEIFRYCCAFIILGKEDRDPNGIVPNR